MSRDEDAEQKGRTERSEQFGGEGRLGSRTDERVSS